MPCRFLLVLGRRGRQTGWIPQQRDKSTGKYERPCGLLRRDQAGMDHASAMTEKFELGRLVATPGAIEATTLPQHFNLVARHARFEARLATLRETRSAR